MKNNKKKKTIEIVLVASIGLALATSCSPKVYHEVIEREKVVYRDSTAWRDSLIYVPVPVGKDHAIVSTRDTSRLETSVAESIAYVDTTGCLHHAITNKQTSLPYWAKIPVRHIYIGVANTRTETLTEYVEVEKPMPWWRSLKIRAFWWLVLACVIGFRRELLALIRKIV